MKITISAIQNIVTKHFRHCPEFNIYTLEDKSIISFERIPNPGYKPDFLPVFLNNLGIKIIISGEMKQSATHLFNRFDIEVIVGVSETTRAAAEQYAEGTLILTGSECHQHHDDC